MNILKVAALTLALPLLGANTAAASMTCGTSDALQGVTHVKPLQETFNVGKAELTRRAGARLFIPAEAGMSVPYLQRQLNCQVQTAGGGQNDPLSVPKVKATVSAAGEYFVVDLRASTLADAKEVHRRSELLLQGK